MTYKTFFKKAPIVSLKGQPVILFDGKHSSLLEALESKKVNIFSECRNGFCGACKTTVISGDVSYITTPLAELKANECLPCCCVPETDLNLKLSCKGVEVVAKRQYNTHQPAPLLTKLAHES
ncbi:2Fe-2S iron-sulfur cluster binding domain-containing protein [Shewanella inventionis]|uniref:class I ribonucleotide reductase maintenance protein YfaE n=1 Tax=Shewanella inventionis TaxID=1738770 RepID=UPI00166B5C1B|nr:class I ribonucleotide reductase maintenance protein YfaE [Shewanella inventionis]MCL1159639.1 class I ribonucleotide reductase maintenance protein YfaE [Shewanella inventionis]UAL41666.1 2Fe-2S iron-sulfur cluster binding domain-containing protein [Shewanella inventionis]